MTFKTMQQILNIEDSEAMLKAISAATEKCTFCGGTGYMHIGVTADMSKKCHNCGGAGVVMKRKEATSC